MMPPLLQSKPSSTTQKQHTPQEKKAGQLPFSQHVDPSSGFYSTPPEMTSLEKAFQDRGKDPLKYGMSSGTRAFENYTSPDYFGNTGTPSIAPAQMMEDEQIKKKKPQAKMDSAQMKEKKKKQIQKKTVQRNSANSFGADFSSKGVTTAMPRPVQQKMENSFGADFSNVAIHKDSGSATNMGALAYAQGNEVHFAPGQYSPETRKGQELLGHELTHVVQQRQGRVQATTQGKGMAINDDPALEREADVMGTKAAEGKKAFGGSTSIEESKNITNSSAQMKAKKSQPKDIKVTLAADKEADYWDEAYYKRFNVGHSWIMIERANKSKDSYGFWPLRGFDPSKPHKTVHGVVKHPDTSHTPTAKFSAKITEQELQKGEKYAEDNKSSGYNLFTYNCTSFARDFFQKCGQYAPSAGLIIEDPNALHNSIEKINGYKGLDSKENKKPPKKSN